MKRIPQPPAAVRGQAPTYGDVHALPEPRRRPPQAVKPPLGKDPFSWSDVLKVLVVAMVMAAIYAAGIVTGFVIDVTQ